MNHCVLKLKGADVLVDREDLFLLSHFRWVVTRPDGKKPYVMTTDPTDGTRRTLYMHRLLTNAPKGMEVDHINGDGLDNRRANLRLATRTENCRNRGKQVTGSSRFVGVSWHKHRQRWWAYIWVGNGIRKSLGYHHDEESAARAYDAAAIDAHGEFAWLNFPNNNERPDRVNDQSAA